MSAPDQPEQTEKPERPLTLFVDDKELIRRLGVPVKVGRVALSALDKQGTGFPRKQPLFGNRRYWPAVRAWFDRQYGLVLAGPVERERRPIPPRIPIYPDRKPREKPKSKEQLRGDPQSTVEE